MSTPRSRRAATTPKGVPLAFNRCLAKAITTGNILNDLVYSLEKARNKGAEPTPEGLAGWDVLRGQWAEIVIKHLDAYDQKET
jgi:hypothetical protein